MCEMDGKAGGRGKGMRSRGPHGVGPHLFWPAQPLISAYDEGERQQPAPEAGV